MSQSFGPHVLDIDLEKTAEVAAARLKEIVLGDLKRRGLVVSISGGIDSACTVALAVRAFGPKNVFGIFLPEEDSSDDSLRLGKALAEKLGIEAVTENIAPALAALGCYQRRDEAIKKVFPEYGDGWKNKIILPQNLLESDRLNVYWLVVESPDGEQKRARLPLKEYLQIVAAVNMKQRTRKMFDYYHADRLHYAVAGTPNRLEYDQGFFVKGGDGLADVKPIAHLYKTQVYRMAAHLGVIPEICNRAPTTDTYSIPQSQEEFYFCLPYDKMDLVLWAHNHKIPAEVVGKEMGFTGEQIERVYKDIESKRRMTRYLHASARLIEPVEEIGKI